MTENKPRMVSALPGTRPVFSHLEAEWLMEIILTGGHERAEYLLGKLVKGANEPEVYAKLLERVRASVTLD